MKNNPTHSGRKYSGSIGKLLVPSVAALAAGISAQASTDYGPAIWRASTHFGTSGYGHKFVVIHDMEGFYGSVYSVLESRGVSVTYAVNSGSGISGYVAGYGRTLTDTDGKPAGEIS